MIDTEKKIGDIINWCGYNYQNHDKDETFKKTQEYTAAVLQNVAYHISQVGREIINTLTLEMDEIDKLTCEVNSLSNVGNRKPSGKPDDYQQ